MKESSLQLRREFPLYLNDDGNYYSQSIEDRIICGAAIGNYLKVSGQDLPSKVWLTVEWDSKGPYFIAQKNHGKDECFWLWSRPLIGSASRRSYRLWPINAGMIEMLARVTGGISTWQGPFNLSIEAEHGFAVEEEEFLASGKEYKEKWGGFERC